MDEHGGWCAGEDDAGEGNHQRQSWRGRRTSSKQPLESDQRSQQSPSDPQASAAPSSEQLGGAEWRRGGEGGEPGASNAPSRAEAQHAQGARLTDAVSTGVSGDREDEEKSAAAVATAVAAAEVLSQRVREAAARMSDAIDQMSRLLLPTPLPLGLAVLFSQCAPFALCVCIPMWRSW